MLYVPFRNPFPIKLHVKLWVAVPNAYHVMSAEDCLFVSWCFDPSQPLGITSGLRETFIKRYIVERTSKAEIRQVEQSEKTESRRENLWNETERAKKTEKDIRTE